MDGDFFVYSWTDVLSGKSSVKDLLEAKGCSATALTVGGFDGVHLGHMALLDAVLAKKNLLPGVVTFTKSPASVINSASFLGSVYTLNQRLEIFKGKGFAFAVVIDFSHEFGRMEGNIFLSILKDFLLMSFMAEGKDFRCGYKGAFGLSQTVSFLQSQKIAFGEIPPVLVDGQRVSSTTIRNLVSSADFAFAKKLLGRPYALDCTVREWEKKGDEYISCSPSVVENQVLPPSGKYDVFLRFFIGQRTELFPSVVEICGKEIKVKLPDNDFVHSGILQAVEFTV